MAVRKSLQLIPSVHRAAHRIAVYVEREARLGVTQAEAHVLIHLLACGDSTVAQIHAAFGHRRSTLTSILDRLSTRGFIQRRSSTADRRTFVISLTAAGRRVAQEAFESLQALEAKAMAGLTRAQLEGFAAVIDALSKVRD